MKARFPFKDDAGLVVGGSSGVAAAGVLHGNTARISPTKSITPLWTNVASDRRDRRFYRQDGFDNSMHDNIGEDRALNDKAEVDANPL
ncbi:MAG: hypothetical protein FWD35_05290 [Oscillospiraceae bacterium]|nr:hypothetical protein [Oscillospiraceae bacterium]